MEINREWVKTLLELTHQLDKQIVTLPTFTKQEIATKTNLYYLMGFISALDTLNLQYDAELED